MKVEGDEDVDNSDPGSEVCPDDEETADENSTDTDSSGGGKLARTKLEVCEVFRG